MILHLGCRVVTFYDLLNSYHMATDWNPIGCGIIIVPQVPGMDFGKKVKEIIHKGGFMNYL